MKYITEDYVINPRGKFHLTDAAKDFLGQFKYKTGQVGWTREFIDANIDNISFRTDDALIFTLSQFGIIDFELGQLTYPYGMELEDAYEIRLNEDGCERLHPLFEAYISPCEP